MKDKRKLLLGMHNPAVLLSLRRIGESHGYSAYVARDRKELLELAISGNHYAYIMDINFTMPNPPDITPAREIWQVVKPRVIGGLAKFAALSFNEETVRMAIEDGIPAHDKSSFNPYHFLGHLVMAEP